MSMKTTRISPLLAGTILIITFHLSGCGEVPPEDSAGLARFSEYYAGELFLLEKTRLSGGDTLSLRSGLDSLSRHFQITRGERDSLLAYYRDSLPRWEAFLTGVLGKLEERERSLRGAGPDPAVDAPAGR